MTTPGVSTAAPAVGVEALELFVDVLSRSEQGDHFYDRLCQAVCRMARMRRAVIFRYDDARRRVRAAGASSTQARRARRVESVRVAPPSTIPVTLP